MNNLDREKLIQTNLKNGTWKTVPRKHSWQVKNKEGAVIAEAPTRHEALKLAVTNTQGN